MTKPRRPTAVTIVAVLQLVFGGLGLLGNGFVLANRLAGGSAFKTPSTTSAYGQKTTTVIDTEAELEKRAPGYTIVTGVNAVVDLLLCLFMIGGGLGLLQVQNWGRLATITWAAAAVLFGLLFQLYNLLVLVPASQQVMQMAASLSGDPMAQQAIAVASSLLYAGPVVALMMLMYPVLVVVILNRPHVKRAFAGLPPLDDFNEPEDDYDDRRDARGRYDDYVENDDTPEPPRHASDDRIRE